MLTRKLKTLLLLTAAVLSFVYVFSYSILPHRPLPFAAPAALYEAEQQGRTFVRVDFDYKWQLVLWMPLVWLEDLVRSEDVVATHGLMREM